MKRSDLGAYGHKVVRCGGKQVLVIAQENRLFAIANRCPHEGYPPSEGTLGPGCVLTCNWHNWKFDLESGEALVGRDPVRTYPVGEREGEIFIDVSEPPAERLRSHALRGIEAAIADNDRPRMAREVARLEHAGFDASEALVHGFRLCNGRLEDGMTHAYAAAADWLSLASRAETPTERLAALLEPLGHIAWDTEGEGEFPYPDAVAEWSGSGFAAAVEAEDETAATTRVRGGLAKSDSYVDAWGTSNRSRRALHGIRSYQTLPKRKLTKAAFQLATPIGIERQGNATRVHNGIIGRSWSDGGQAADRAGPSGHFAWTK